MPSSSCPGLLLPPIHQQITREMGIPSDHFDLAYRVSKESSRTRHRLSGLNDMSAALEELQQATATARSVQPVLYIYNIVCDSLSLIISSISNPTIL